MEGAGFTRGPGGGASGERGGKKSELRSDGQAGGLSHLSHREIDITGVGSVGPCGAVSGPLHGPVPAPSVVTAWPTEGVRYAVPALPFRTADVLPKINTRRLDRLSTWSLAAAALALRDAGLDLAAVDGARTAVVSAIGLGCLNLTEAYLGSAHEHGWQQTGARR